MLIVFSFSFLHRSEDGTPGCTKVVLEDLPTTIDNIGVEEFAELLKGQAHHMFSRFLSL